MNIREEWNALGKLIGWALDGLLFVGAFFGLIALADLLGI